MHKSVPMIFAILMLISLILCSACVSQPPANQTSQQNVGLTQVSEGSPSISFDVAQQNLIEYRPDPTNESAGIKTIYYIHGTNLDVSGDASSWIFGVRHSGGTGLDELKKRMIELHDAIGAGIN